MFGAALISIKSFAVLSDQKLKWARPVKVLDTVQSHEMESL